MINRHDCYHRLIVGCVDMQALVRVDFRDYM
jgi:hypothetical protein